MKLAELVAELADCDKQERIEMLLDYARSLCPRCPRSSRPFATLNTVWKNASRQCFFSPRNRLKAWLGMPTFPWKPLPFVASFPCSGKVHRALTC